MPRWGGMGWLWAGCEPWIPGTHQCEGSSSTTFQPASLLSLPRPGKHGHGLQHLNRNSKFTSRLTKGNDIKLKVRCPSSPMAWLGTVSERPKNHGLAAFQPARRDLVLTGPARACPRRRVRLLAGNLAADSLGPPGLCIQFNVKRIAGIFWSCPKGLSQTPIVGEDAIYLRTRCPPLRLQSQNNWPFGIYCSGSLSQPPRTTRAAPRSGSPA